MYNHRVFKISDGEDLIIFIPSLSEVYRVSQSVADRIPDYVNSNKPHPVSRWDDLPDYIFFGVNLILTDHCNLACTYCYGEYSPKRKLIMSEYIARAAIDYIADCARKMRRELIYANMFGGEPTQAWDVLTSSTLYLRKKADEISCRSRATITTNGCMLLNQAKWLAENMDGINISFDGYKDIQDIHRSKSFDQVFAVAKDIYARAPTKLMLRATISDYSVKYLPDIVQFFGENFPGTKQMYEPLFTIGRGRNSKCTMPSPKLFFEKFLESLLIAEKFGCKLKTSVLNLGAKSSEFCGVAARNFMVTPDGRITTCNRMAGDANETERSFTYGHFDATVNKFVFDERTYQQLKRVSAKNISECQDCFAAFSCRGDCAANKAVINPNDFWKKISYRCEEIQQFVKDALVYVIDRESTLTQV